jgi:oxygen-independent coproporphyrinogen-3 oxidase
MLAAILSEISLQKNFLDGQQIETIYFGGGTPSLLTADEIQLLLDKIHHTFEVSASAEITIEANPDDLSPQKVRELKQTLLNRFSIGIQSFFQEDLLWMNRAHNASEAESSVKRVQDAGFENITVDLIYGYPLLSNEKWLSNIQQVIELNVPHVSAYSITVEPKTALASFINKGKQSPMNETQSAAQFLTLMEALLDGGFEHYEISNFAKPGRHSRHNSNYWNGVPYLGLGPSAHSYNGKIRQWNVANNSKYIFSIGKKEIPAEIEVLSQINHINEYIMTALRTSNGIDLKLVTQNFGNDFRVKIVGCLAQFEEKNWLMENSDFVRLTNAGKLYADYIASELFFDAEE